MTFAIQAINPTHLSSNATNSSMLAFMIYCQTLAGEVDFNRHDIAGDFSPEQYLPKRWIMQKLSTAEP
jgi:hypothetical protein